MPLIKFQLLIRTFVALLFLSSVYSCQNAGTNDTKIERGSIDNETEQITNVIPKTFTADSIRLLSTQLDSIFSHLHNKRGFNGTVLVTKYNKVVYKGAFGYKDFSTKDTLTIRTAFQLASVSKQFTAMAIMMLQEQGKLDYDDSIQKYIPNFPYHGITIRQLLTHRSGLGNYTYFADKLWPSSNLPMNNQDVVDLMVTHKPGIYYQPDTRFDYSNTGYALLATVVTKASGLPFSNFLRQHIFKPLKMHDTFTYKKNKVERDDNIAFGHSAGRRKRANNHLDTVLGDKGIYSTVEDLYKWDQALYTERLVSRRTLAEAFKGSIIQNKNDEDYGFGWRLLTLDNQDKAVYHGGLWHGYATYLLRNPKDHSALIILTNVTNGTFNHLKDIRTFLYPPKTTALLANKAK